MYTIEQLQQLLEATEIASTDEYYRAYCADQIALRRIGDDMARSADFTYANLSPAARGFADRLRGDIAAAKKQAWS
jgi:hypothetical protein